jgi:lysozyme
MNRERLLASIAKHEGFKAAPYRDTKGLWTWLEGRCLETNPLSGSDWKALLDTGSIALIGTPAAAQYLVGIEIDKAVRALSMFFSAWLTFGDVRQNALLEMRYQIKGFPSSFPDLCEAIDIGNWDAVANEALDSKWAREDSPRRAEEIARMLRENTFDP